MAEEVTFTFELRGVTQRWEAIDLAALAVERRGGPTAADQAFRQEAFSVIGSITAAGGQVEAALKRLITIEKRRPRADFSLADYDWSKLHGLLMKICAPPNLNERRQRIKHELSWAESHHLRQRRNDAVHGAWWLFADCGARVSRWPRNESSHIIVEATLDPWREIADRCWEFVDRLNALYSAAWPSAVLPAQH